MSHEHVDHVATADREPVDGGDDRLGDVADDAVEGLDLEHPGLGRAVVAGLGALLLVAAGAERLVAGARERDDADRRVDPRGLERREQLVDGAPAERVVALGPVDRDPRQPGVDLVGDVLQVVHADHRANVLRRAASARL